MTKPRIAVFGANPAWQKTIYFEKFVPGSVNRAQRIELYAGGKGVNVCRAAGHRGIADTKLYQFTGGANGALHEEALRKEKIEFCSVHVSGETRCCTTCLDSSGSAMTELIEPSHAVSPEEAAEMLRVFEGELKDASAVAISGSLPDGTDPEIYTRIALLAEKYKLPLLIDALHPETLNVVSHFILKINMDELKKITGETDGIAALKKGAELWPESVLAITDGGAGAYLAVAGNFLRFDLPEIEVVSALGAGDTCSAVLLSEYLNSGDIVESFARALAAASANCLTPLAGEFFRRDAESLRPLIREL